MSEKFKNPKLLGCKVISSKKGRELSLFWIAVPCSDGVGQECYTIMSPFNSDTFPKLRDSVGNYIHMPKYYSFLQGGTIWANEF